MSESVKSPSAPHPAARANLYRAAIVGAASLKGKEIAEMLNERNFPAVDVRLLDDDEALGQLEAIMRSVRETGLETGLQQQLAALGAKTPDVTSLWEDYEDHAVFYNGLLIEVGELAPDVEAGQGFIPADIARRVHQYPVEAGFVDLPAVPGHHGHR